MKLALILLLLSSVLGAQESKPLVSSSTHVVLLDVVVTDGAGKPVGTLKQDDFSIIENGVAQKISSFEAPVSNSTGVMLPNSPHTIILIDQLNINFPDLSYARDRTLLFLSRNHLEYSPTAIMAIGLNGPQMVQEFTQDPKLLKDTLTAFHPALLNNVEGAMEQGKVQERANAAINALLDIARAAVGSSYNLNVIWITNGFSGTLKEKKAVDGKPNGLRRLANLLASARIRLYTIDPGGAKPLEVTVAATPMMSTHSGLYSGQSMSDASAEEDLASGDGAYEANQLLERLAKLTGGKAFYGRNDVEVALAQAVNDGNSNYSISYSPTNGDFKGEYRKIEIRTGIPGTMAHTRLGYYAISDDATQTPATREDKWTTALASPLPYSAFALTCLVSYDAANGKAAGPLTSKPTPSVMAAEQQSIEIVRAVALSGSGAVLTGWSWRIDWKKTWTNRVSTVSFDKPLPKKAKSLRFLVSDPDGDHIGTCDYRIPQ